MSLQDAMKADYQPKATFSSKRCRLCTHARPSKAADSMLVCRQHGCTVHRDGSCRLHKAIKP